jgi:hypothetical protein
MVKARPRDQIDLQAFHLNLFDFLIGREITAALVYAISQYAEVFRLQETEGGVGA